MTITLPEELEKQLEAAAQARGMDLDSNARSVLEGAARSDRAALLAEADRVRAMTPLVKQTDSSELLQAARDARHDR
jgi:hypothetical protein